MVSFKMVKNCTKDHCKSDDIFKKRFESFLKRFGEDEKYDGESVLRWLGYDLNKGRRKR